MRVDKSGEASGFGVLLRAGRHAAGVSQRELAARAGLSVAAVRDLEQGRSRRPRPTAVEALVGALGLSGDGAASLRHAATGPYPAAQQPPARQVQPAEPIRLAILGPLTVHGGREAVPVGRGSRRVVLGRLALSMNAPVPVSDLVSLLWETPPAAPANALHTYLSRLRSALQPPAPDRAAVISRTPAGYQLTLTDEQLDLAEFRHQVRQARRAEPAVALDLLEAALALWHGAPLADIPQLRDHPLVTAVVEERIAATLRYAELALTAGQADRCLRQLRELTTANPLHEPLHARLIAALAASNLQACALASYTEIRRRLVDDLGVEPGPELMNVHRRVLRQEPMFETAPSFDESPVADKPRPPAQLPADIHRFTGRTAALARLDGILDAGHHPPAVVITAVSGTAGVGKTALAVHWAHQVVDQFPDGQLYVNLRGFDPGGSPMTPDEAVGGFLDALGVTPQRLPADPTTRLGLYRSLLAGKRILLVLDNARDAEQVRPLLPGAPGCFAVVTSRNPLSGLVAADGAHPLTVEALSQNDARQLLAHRIGSHRTSAEPDAVAEIVDQCAGLPIALAITAARAATQPGLSLADLASDLLGNRLDALSTGDASTDVRSVFSWSYQALSPAAARLFRLLGRHPTPELSTAAAASLLGLPSARVRPVLSELTRAHLVSEYALGRYAMHDLLHEYASQLALDEQPDAATVRMLDHYLHTARAADRLLDPARDPGPLGPPSAGVTVVPPTDHNEALRWFTTEHRVLLAAVDYAANAGFGPYAWQLADAAATFLYRQGMWHDQVTAQRHALHAAAQSADVPAQGSAHVHLARTYIRLREYHETEAHLRAALELYREHGDPDGQAQTHHYFGALREQQGRHREALDHAQQAVAICRASGLRFGLGHALNAVSWYHILLGNHHDALTAGQEAIKVTQDLGDRAGQANAWDTIGYAYHHLGDDDAAVASYRRAIDLYRDLGDRYYGSLTLTRLAERHRAAGRLDSARDAYQQALVVLEELTHPDSERVRAELLHLGM
ncbi:BTAD domain-containing putative transcriptional regulator [Micromonospora chersina]|uniref:BTAD domain-containing putative transcriptional regulator n=1 Tax=Micromonospora chersina TaxID=47854 RepID=UPI0033F19530